MERIADKHYLANGAQPKPDEAIAWASETKAKMVDLKFCDLLGSWQHMTMPLRALDASACHWSAGRVDGVVGSFDPRLVGDLVEKEELALRAEVRRVGNARRV